ncbi:MAG: asparagine synthase (glutamine-hydrolyzing) [Clostridiales bacterium]|jgi:asparagine synthase (glutamine-hydrolysing)|nr:asparagine synthase (glutamine-hydrolyzing) [Clostridiales bacterium]
MCGFVGFTGNKYDSIREMTAKIAHRGPDGEGYFAANGINLGFRRLAFLDLEHGNQPMTTADGRFSVVFNGEIYNYVVLRDELKEIGYEFATNSDTEVLLNLYVEFGAGMLNKLRGMFAFAIFDGESGEIFAARDYFGIKPFYYGIFGGELVFASEIKAFTAYPDFEKAINHDALAAYLSFQYSVLNESLFKGVFKLPPAHFMRYINGKVQLTRYWQAEFSPRAETSVDEIDDIIGDSIKAHLISDVPIGSFLSSGVDSSLLAARFGGAATFTVGFDFDGYNEIPYAQELSQDLGIENHSKVISTAEYWDCLGKIQYHMDEPLADPAAVALYFVSQVAKDHVKGVLSGEGADELFGGYNIYQEPLALRPLTILPKFLRRAIGALAAKLPNFKGRNYLIRASMDVEERFIGNAKIFSESERAALLKIPTNMPISSITAPIYAKAKGYDDITKMQYLDIHLWLVGDILLKADKMTMAHSIEGRVPYMDKEVFAIAAALPTPLRVSRKGTKLAFRQAAARRLKPKWADKKKLGFPVPIRLWLRDDAYYARVKAAFESEDAAEFFHVDKLVALLDAHRLGKIDNSRKIWTVYMFLLWYKEYF